MTLMLSGCFLLDMGSSSEYKPPTDTEPELTNRVVPKIDFGTAAYKDIPLTDVAGKDVYLVKVNRADTTVAAAATGHAQTLASSSQRSVTDAPFPMPPSGQIRQASGVFSTSTGATLTRYDHAQAQAFNSSPPPVSGAASRSTRSALVRGDTVGTSTASFWVQDAHDDWIEITATLRAAGTHSNIWVTDDNFDETNAPVTDLTNTDDKITEDQAVTLAEKFDEIYRVETPVFGYENGGNLAQTSTNYGGVDGDPKIQILVYDIDYDYDPNLGGGTFGFFWSKDYYSQNALTSSGLSYKTNEAEMFYIDAYFTDRYPDGAYSTLAHEFQHMINFNVKTLRYSTYTKTVEAATWYNEMLSMLAEDIIGPLIDIPPSNDEHVTKDRMRLFLADYLSSGVTDWLSGNDVLKSYASAYAFGAYLARNYGGAQLVKAIMENNTTDEASITAALAAFNAEMTFKNALSRYGEAFVHSNNSLPAAASFDKTVATTISGTIYTFSAFDIWDMPNGGSGSSVPVGSNTYQYPDKGPMVWPLEYAFPMRPYSVILQSRDEWRNISPDADPLTIHVTKPTSANIELYLMVRDTTVPQP
jgi:hypothetical protein